MVPKNLTYLHWTYLQGTLYTQYKYNEIKIRHDIYTYRTDTNIKLNCSIKIKIIIKKKDKYIHKNT